MADPISVGDGHQAAGAEALLHGPFQRQGLVRRALPFAVVFVLAAASLGLPPGPKSAVDALVAVALLAAASAAVLLPWSRLPAGLTVLVPLTCTLSVFMMIMSARGATSGVGTVILAPLIWTALYHRRWESAAVVAAIVAVQVITSMTPVAEPAATTVRRVVFWALLGALLSVATHDLRGRLQRLVAAREELVRQTVALEAAAREQALTDPLTNLPNRRGFEAFIANRPRRRPFVILVLDVDGLKRVNDTEGHAAGDLLLVKVAEVVRQAMRRGDVLARLGGDEFAAYLIDAGQGDGCRVAERMLDALAAPDRALTARVSIGVAVGAANDEADEVYAAADAAMYRAKRAGGMRYETALCGLAPVLPLRS